MFKEDKFDSTNLYIFKMERVDFFGGLLYYLSFHYVIKFT